MREARGPGDQERGGADRAPAATTDGVELGEHGGTDEGADEAGQREDRDGSPVDVPSLWWEKPETSDVPLSEKWTAAEAAAGATPTAGRRVEDVTPSAMPRDPSMSWAMRPTAPRTMSLRMCGLPSGPVKHWVASLWFVR